MSTALRQNAIYYIVVLLVGIFFPILTYLYAIFLLAQLLSPRHSFVRRLILSWFAFFGVLIAAYLVFGLLHIGVPFRLFALALPLLPLGILVATKRQPKIGQIASSLDIASLVVSVITLVLLCIPVFKNDRATFLLFLSSGEDNASHLALTNYNIQNQKFAYFTPENKTGLIGSLAIYQQGMHINQAFVVKLLPQQGPLSLLYKFYLQGVYYYSLMIFMMCYLTLDLASRLGKKKVALIPIFYGLLPVTVLLLGMGIFLHLLGWGFYTQVTSYLLMLIMLHLVDNYRQYGWSLEIYCLSILGVVAISNVWYFLLPIVVPPLLVFWPERKRLWANRRILGVAVVGALFALAPIAINMLRSTKGSPLNEPGGVYIMSGISVIVSLLAVAILWTWPKKNRTTLLQSLVVTATAAGVFTIFIWAYQRLTIGHNEYYYFKSVYTVFLLLFIVLGGVILAKLGSLLYHKKQVTWLPIATALVLTVGIFVLKPVYPRVYINNWFNGVLDLVDIDHIETAALRHANDVVFVGDCNVASDYIANRWTGALLLSENAKRSRFETRRITGRPEQEASSLANYLHAQPAATIRVTKKCLDQPTSRTILDSHNHVVYE